MKHSSLFVDMDKLIYYQTQLQKVCLEFLDVKNLQVQGTRRKLASGRPTKGSEMCTYVQNVEKSVAKTHGVPRQTL